MGGWGGGMGGSFLASLSVGSTEGGGKVVDCAQGGRVAYSLETILERWVS